MLGKRNAGEAIDKAVSAKKLKLERDEAVEAKKKLEKKQPKKVESSSSSEDSSSDESDDEPKVKAALFILKPCTIFLDVSSICLLYTSPSPRDGLLSRMPSSA